MQNQEINSEFTLISVPTELLQEIGVEEMSVVQISVFEGRLIIERADVQDYKCDEDCENCPFFDPGCDEEENCEGCPCCCPECGECMCDAVMIEGESDDE